MSAVLAAETVPPAAVVATRYQPSHICGNPDKLTPLQRELIEVISKYVSVNPDDIKVHLDKQDNMDVLEVNIVLPEQNR